MSEIKRPFDRDKLARHLHSKIDTEKLSVRAAAAEIGCSPATLTRLLKGARAKNYPEGLNLIRAASWVGKSLAHFTGGEIEETTIADVEAHLRALPDLPEDAAEALVSMVQAAYDAYRLREKKGKKR